MTTFDEREAGFEAKFTHDADVEFRVTARADKLLGGWAAGKLGLSADAADDYAREVIRADFKHAGHDDVIAKVFGDLAARSLGVTEAEVRAALTACLAAAREQVMGTA